MMAVSHAEDSNGSSRMVGQGTMRCSWDVVITSDYHEHYVNYIELLWIWYVGR